MADEVLGKLSESDEAHTWEGAYLFYCPGCKCGHLIRDRRPSRCPPGYNVAVWEFNGDLIKPTFSPSYLTGLPNDKGEPFQNRRCHSYIRDGKIQFLDDCYHDLKGQTVTMRPYKDW